MPWFFLLVPESEPLDATYSGWYVTMLRFPQRGTATTMSMVKYLLFLLLTEMKLRVLMYTFTITVVCVLLTCLCLCLRTVIMCIFYRFGDF